MINYQAVSLEREQQLLLHDVDLHIGEGEFVYLIGKVGSGKSSLLKSMYAEIPIIEGQARVFDYDLCTIRSSQIPYLRRRLGIIFQDFQLLVDRTVQQNLEFVLKATGWKNKEEMQIRIDDVLKLVGMENKGYRMPNTLSGGEQQRVVIARALLNNPSVILADEPTGNLDPETGRNIVQLLYDICHQRNTTVLMSTHNLQLLEQFPGRVFRVEEGRLVEDSSHPIANESIEDTKEETPETVEPIVEEPMTDELVSEDVTVEEPIAENPLSDERLSIASESEFNSVQSEPIAVIDNPEPQSETIVEVEVEIQSSCESDSTDNNNAEARCSQSDNQLVERNYNGQSGQIPSESALL